MIKNTVYLAALALTISACSKKSEVTEYPHDSDVEAYEEAGSYEDDSHDYGESDITNSSSYTIQEDTVNFATDSHILSSMSREILKQQSLWLKDNVDRNIVIEGHCDERGTREYNLALGERRANSVRNYLIALGVSPVRIRTISYGKERPLELGSNPRAWEVNRRAVTVIE